MTATVTAVIPTRNRLGMLRQALDSALSQVGVEIQVVVVDEGSSDGTPAFLAAIRDDRVRVVRHDEPLRLPGARNAGIALVDTEWVAFCDDDDLWAPDKLAAQVERLERVPSSEWSCVGAVYVDERLRIVGGHRPPPDGDVHAAVLADNVIPSGGSGVLARTALVRELGGFRSLPASEDWDLWIRLARVAPLAAVDRPLLGYRVLATSHSHDVGLMERTDDALAEEYAEERRRLGVELDWVEKQRYYGRQEVHGGDRRAAARRFASIARRTRRPGDAVAAVLGALSPTLLERLWQRRMTEHIDSEWMAQAQPWLTAIAARSHGET